VSSWRRCQPDTGARTMPKHLENPQSPRSRLPGRGHDVTSPSLPIAERVRQARLAARLTQEELGGGIFSRSYLSAVERGKMLPSIPALAVLAGRLGVPMSFLLGESEFDLSTLANRRADSSGSEAQTQET
jgi:ribosome-binding protein aMBF1 (putative translation factor)